VATTSYLRNLRDFACRHEIRGPWAVVGSTDVIQGWKFHISSIPTEAVALLQSVLPVLRRHGVSFKIARNRIILESLNEGGFTATQIGKFATVYPKGDTEAVVLARELIEVTKGFHGPRIPTDIRLGDVLYARYGCFNPHLRQNRLGQDLLLIQGSDGSLRQDDYAVPFELPEGISNPFVELASRATGTEADAATCDPQPPSDKLFGPGYLILDVMRAHPKGSVFFCLDVRRRECTSAKVIKQGRQHCFSDPHGRDMRTRLRRQYTMHRALANRVQVPQVDSYFEVRGDGYLVLEHLEGTTFETLISRTLGGASWRTLPLERRTELLSCLNRLVEAVSDLHRAEFVHRDLTPSNIFITRAGEVYLLDLELAHAVADPSLPLQLGTPGFMSPGQKGRGAASYADDVYAVGCVLIYALTGLEPDRVLFAGAKRRRHQLLFLAAGAPVEVAAIAERCVRQKAASRPDLATVARTLRRADLAHDQGNFGREDPIDPLEWCNTSLMQTLRGRARDLAKRGARGILEDAIREEASQLWLSSTYEQAERRVAKKSSARYELRADAHRGVAGVVYLLGRLGRFGLAPARARDRVRSAVSWLLARTPQDGQSFLPGLYFGEAGTAVALAEAVAGRLIARERRVNGVIRDALHGPLDWPDMTHGAAGQGVAGFYCAARLGDPALLGFTQRCAHYLVETQQADGSWRMPPGVDGMSGQTLTGFAHGVAGAVYFLSEYAGRYDDDAVRQAWLKALHWLGEQAISVRDGSAAEWQYSTADPSRWRWWCHGAPGIALALLRSYEHSRNPVHAELASKALHCHPFYLLESRLSQCHGVSGIGEIYLEAARVLNDSYWLARATWIMQLLNHLRRERRSGSAIWLVEEPNEPTADLMVGCGGVVHFLLRFGQGPADIGFPMLLDAVRS
jgi:serine/threonine protein kinase